MISKKRLHLEIGDWSGLLNESAQTVAIYTVSESNCVFNYVQAKKCGPRKLYVVMVSSMLKR